MAFGAKKIFPLDTRPGTAIGVSIPFNAPSVFYPTYVTKDAIKNNLINFLLTNQTERYLNNDFGANLRKFVFEQISNNTLNLLKDTIQSLIKTYFPNVRVENIEFNENPDYNEITVMIYYNIINTGINDQVQITFT
jgi:phage baseplate assembly protein W